MSAPGRLLVVAPHPDDEILGAGGSIARFAGAGGEAIVLTVAAHMPPLYPADIHRRTVAEARRAHGIVGVKSSIFLDYPAVLLREAPVAEVNARILTVLKDFQPQVVLVPYVDRHVDHRVVFDACMVACRPVGPGRGISVLAAYETVSETHWTAPHIEPNFTPSWVVDITAHIEPKIEAMRMYESQLQGYPAARSVEALRALALFRGSQIGVGFGEAFQLIRMTAPPDLFNNGGG
ncbi:MAG: PIG-L deacetylase family protein [Actinomycetota bacterium]